MVVIRAVVACAMMMASVAHADEFVIEPAPYLIGQAPDWLDRDHVVWHDPFQRDEDDDGTFQIYRSALDGSEKVCLTCGLDGPNQVPAVRPQGDWVLFHSWAGHALTVGAPGFGGIGSDVWVVRPDGSQRTNLTQSSELYDHFHAYWSPDGRYIVWTALNWNADEGGNGKSDVRVARFDPTGPRLTDVRVVRPGNGHWYETQWWAPDGSGFLYTETVDHAVNPELFFCRLPARAGECKPQRLTTNDAWDEQAVFTPDMDRVLFMSSRNLPGAHNDWVTVARFLDIPADYDFAIVLSVFVNSFLQPRLQQSTDLYELQLRWNRARTRFKPGKIRRLTTTGEQGWVIPEFAWDPTGRRLLWTQNRFLEGDRLDEGCVKRKLREGFVGRLAAVKGVADLDLDIDVEMRSAAAELLRDPKSYLFAEGGCGGENPSKTPSFDQQTLIGRYRR